MAERGVDSPRGRVRAALLVDRSGTAFARFAEGGRLVADARGARADEVILPAGAAEPFLAGIFTAEPFDDVALVFCRDLPPRLRLRLGDLGVRALRSDAPPARVRERSGIYLEWPERRFGELLVPALVRIGDEAWDVPTGLPMLLAAELVGWTLDRSVLCFAEECGRCETVAAAAFGEPSRRRRICRLPAREGASIEPFPAALRPTG